ncbi:MAG: PHP domain-containing protein [Bacteroidetes bacterium]|nr:PHP domain-containing protein [Bacteroidota bacterium]
MAWVDFHVHTYHSYDSLMKPLKLMQLAHQRGLSGLVVSDHDTIAGGLECKARNPYPDLKIFVSSEIKTNVGDITGINLKEEIYERNFSDVVAQIKRQGGLVLLVHPYHHHKLSEINFDSIDLIEGFNAREFPHNNMKAIELAQKHQKPIVAGSDAHLYGEIGNARTEYESLDDLTKPISLNTKRNQPHHEIASQLIKAYKRKDAHLLYKWAKWAPKYLYRRLK